MFGATRSKFALAFAGLSMCGAAPADTVVLAGKPPFQNVTITDVRRGRLHFRGVSGEILQKPLGLVASVVLDSLPQLTAADAALAAGDPDAALDALTQCESQVRESWQRALIASRRLAVLSAAGRTDQALKAFLDLVREDPQIPTENLPPDIGPAGSPANRAALVLLRKSRLRGLSPSLEQALAMRRLELMLLEDPDAVRREFAPSDEPASVQAAASQPSDEDTTPLLFGTPRAAPTATPVELTRASPLRKEANRLLTGGQRRTALNVIERAMPFVRKNDRGWWTLDAARCRIDLREYARAADELLAVATAAETTDRDLSARALYYVGLAHEGLNRPDVAADQYRELRGRNDLPDDLRAEVEAALERLRSK